MSNTRLVNTTFSHSVPAAFHDRKLLDYFCGRFPYHTRAEWEKLIHQGQVKLDGIAVSPEARLHKGMRVEYHMENYLEPAVPISFHAILRRDDLALVHKPAGLPVHRTGRVFVNTLVNLFRSHCGDQSWSPLHRLDAETSGIVAFARGSEALSRYSSQKPGTKWIKLYLAVVQGSPDESGVIDIPLNEKNDDWIHTRMHPDPLGRSSVTQYRCLHRTNQHALLLLRPLTGRKHQLRAHCAASGFPIVGDKMYGLEGNFYLQRMKSELTEDDYAKLGATHQLLHAFHLEIRAEDGSGISGQDVEVPDGFLKYFPQLGGKLLLIPDGEFFRELRGY